MNLLKEVYVQQWKSIGWNDDDDYDTYYISGALSTIKMFQLHHSLDDIFSIRSILYVF